MDSAFGYGASKEAKAKATRVIFFGPPIQRITPNSEETYITTDMPAPPIVGDGIQLNLEDLPPMTILMRQWIYEPEIKKWHLRCQVG